MGQAYYNAICLAVLFGFGFESKKPLWSDRIVCITAVFIAMQILFSSIFLL